MIVFMLLNTILRTQKHLNYENFMLHTPLEQFQIILLFSIKLFCFDFSITNLVLVNALVIGFFTLLVYFFSSTTNSSGTNSFFFIPNT